MAKPRYRIGDAVQIRSGTFAGRVGDVLFVTEVPTHMRMVYLYQVKFRDDEWEPYRWFRTGKLRRWKGPARPQG